MAVAAALSRIGRRFQGWPARVAPTAVLIGSALAVALSGPHAHYGMLLAVAPCLAAAVHGVHATAGIGVLAVALFGVLRHDLAFADFDLWLGRLSFVAAAAVVGVLVARGREGGRRLRESRDVALALQQGLLPRKLPGGSAVEIGHRYLPSDGAAGVGGDWFDVIRLSGARVALVIGDVVGRGVHAAALMGRLRTVLLTLADFDLPPDELLVRMDEVVVRLAADCEDGCEVGASCLYLVYDPVAGRCVGARAGHPPPALLTADGAVEFPALPANPPLGLGGTPYESAEFALPESALLVLYTDGLLGLRRRGLDEALAGLAAGLSAGGRRVEDVCDGILASLLGGKSGTATAGGDDAALLVARARSGGGRRVASWRIAAEPQAVSGARALVSGTLAEWELADHAFTAELVVSELLTNAIRYASGPVGLRMIYDHALICEVSDGSSTAPHARHARLMDEGGRGLYLVGQLADRWGTRYSPDGKTIWAEHAVGAPG